MILNPPKDLRPQGSLKKVIEASTALMTRSKSQRKAPKGPASKQSSPAKVPPKKLALQRAQPFMVKVEDGVKDTRSRPAVASMGPMAEGSDEEGAEDNMVDID